MSQIQYSKSSPQLKYKLIILTIVTVPFLVGFILNLTSNQSLFNANLNTVPSMQNNQSLGSTAFINFMNVISNIFNPVLCAGYIILFFIISYRKLQILVFLIWFIFLSYLLSVLKTLIHQPRPYWIAESGIKMLQWTCYTQYGCPSGHSMLGIVLIEFVIRFFARVHKFVNRYIILFYLGGFILQILVMFSRVILGMHSYNQVLFGFMIGAYTFVPYYLFLQNIILKMCIFISESKKIRKMVIVYILMLLCLGLEIVFVLTIDYNNISYQQVITNTSGCSNAKIFKSFQYKCFEDSAIIMAMFGILLSFMMVKQPRNMAKMLFYSRLSIKYILKLIITIIIALVPIAIFLNPLWAHIDTSNQTLAFIIWGCNNFGFLLGIMGLIFFGPEVCRKCNFELYQNPTNYEQYVKFEVKNVYKKVVEHQSKLTQLIPSNDYRQSLTINLQQ